MQVKRITRYAHDVRYLMTHQTKKKKKKKKEKKKRESEGGREKVCIGDSLYH